jgi:hypothetical protein
MNDPIYTPAQLSALRHLRDAAWRSQGEAATTMAITLDTTAYRAATKAYTIAHAEYVYRHTLANA